MIGHVKGTVALLILCTTACTVKSENASDTSAATSSTAAAAPGGDTFGPAVGSSASQTTSDASASSNASSTKPTATTTPKSTDMLVTELGIGPIHAGMTVEEVAQAMGGGFGAPNGGTAGCTYAVLTKAPPGLAVMLQDGRVARVEVRRGTYPTSAGAKIGDSEARIKSLYPGQVVTTPHKYVKGGHYLTVTPSDPNHHIVFETDGKKVTEFRSGRVPEVDQVERCG